MNAGRVRTLVSHCASLVCRFLSSGHFFKMAVIPVLWVTQAQEQQHIGPRPPISKAMFFSQYLIPLSAMRLLSLVRQDRAKWASVNFGQ